MASMRNWLNEKKGRVVVVHCKAGKGRSGTASCSYLISEEGWAVQKALNRFTERRMRPNMGKGVSIPSQLRWIGYVDRWAKHGKLYVERQVEVLEVHCWGLRDGVKIQIEGFVEDGKIIKSFHVFTTAEREIVRGEVKATGMAQAVHEVMYKNGFGASTSKKDLDTTQSNLADSADAPPAKDQSAEAVPKTSQESLPLGTGDVVFRPTKRVVLPTNDINIDVERRNKTAFDLTMVTAVAHVWFNTHFEGNGPEQGGNADQSGIFEIKWEAMDGIKGSSRKGTQAFERIAVVWRALGAEEGRPGVLITQPKEGEEVTQPAPADWRGTKDVEPSEGKDLGVRTASPTHSQGTGSGTNSIKGENSTNQQISKAPESSDNELAQVKSHGPNGEEVLEAAADASGSNKEPATIVSNSPHVDGASGTESVQKSQEPTGSIVQGLQYHVSGAAATSELPDGRPESELKTAKEHILGHLRLGKDKSNQ